MKSTRIIFAIVAFGAALLVGTAAAQLTPLGLKAYGERLQGEARIYQQLQQQQLQSGPTALGLEAWGKRLQGEARIYQQLQQQGPTALGLKAWGERLQGEARIYQQRAPHNAQSPVELINAQERARARDASVVGTKVQPLTPVERIIAQERGRSHDPALFRVPATTPIQIVEPGGFAWGDAGIGAAGAIALMLVGFGTVLVLRANRVRSA